jgi:hypothetical protein
MDNLEEKLRQAYNLIWMMWSAGPFDDNEIYPEITGHPAFKPALQQNTDQFFEFLDRVSERVKDWPAWMRGSVNYRTEE